MHSPMLSVGLVAGLAAGLAALAAVPAAAQDPRSQYTSIKAPQCKNEKSRDLDSAAWTCPGVAGFVVAAREDDVRQTVSFGRTVAAARKEPAATAHFGPPNIAGETIEWRFPAGSKQPVATIQRWTLIPAEGPRRGILVVTRLPPGPVCHVAYVEARNKEANVIARKAVDELAKGFDCKNGAQVLGGGADVPVMGR